MLLLCFLDVFGRPYHQIDIVQNIQLYSLPHPYGYCVRMLRARHHDQQVGIRLRCRFATGAGAEKDDLLGIKLRNKAIQELLEALGQTSRDVGGKCNSHSRSIIPPSQPQSFGQFADNYLGAPNRWSIECSHISMAPSTLQTLGTLGLALSLLSAHPVMPAPIEAALPQEPVFGARVAEVEIMLREYLATPHVVVATAPLSEITSLEGYVIAVGLDYVASNGTTWDPGEEALLRVYRFHRDAPPEVLQEYRYSGTHIERIELVRPPGSDAPLLLVQAQHMGGSWCWRTLTCFTIDPAFGQIQRVSGQHWGFGEMYWFDDLQGWGPTVVVWRREPKWNPTPDMPLQSEFLHFTTWQGDRWGATVKLLASDLISDEALDIRSALLCDASWLLRVQHIDPLQSPREDYLVPIPFPDGESYWSNEGELGGWQIGPIPEN